MVSINLQIVISCWWKSFSFPHKLFMHQLKFSGKKWKGIKCENCWTMWTKTHTHTHTHLTTKCWHWAPTTAFILEVQWDLNIKIAQSRLLSFVQTPCTMFCQPLYYIYIYAFSRRFYPKQRTVHSGYTFFYQYVCSLGIEPMTFCAANAML